MCEVFCNCTHCWAEATIEPNHDALAPPSNPAVNFCQLLWSTAERFFDEHGFACIERGADILGMRIVPRCADNKLNARIGDDLPSIDGTPTEAKVPCNAVRAKG